MSSTAEPEQGGDSGELRRLGVLIAVNFIDMIGFMIVLPLLPFYALKLDASPELIGGMIASFSIAQLVSAPIWGRVSDRYGRRPALLIGLSASAVAYVVFGLAHSVWLLFLSRAVQGAGGGTTGVAQAYVADSIRPSRRAQALGWLSAATSAGVVIGPTIGSLASHWGQEAPGFIAAALCTINAVFCWRWLPESRQPTSGGRGGAERKPLWNAAVAVLRHPRGAVPRFIWIYAVGMLAFTMITGVLALYLNAKFNVTETTIGKFFTYVGVLSVVMRSLLLGPIVSRIGETGAMRWGTAILVLGLVLYPAAETIWQLILVIPLVPIGTALLFPATTSLMSRVSEKSEMGTTMGVAQTYAGIARVVAPLLATSLFQRLGHPVPFFVAAGIVAVVSVLAFQVVQPTASHSAETAVPH